MDKGWAPPNPSRLANGQGLGAPNPSQLGAAAPQPSTTCKWTRVGPPPPTLHDLQTDNPSRRANKHAQPFTTCKWTRVGPPNLQMDKGWGPQPITTWGGRAPQPFKFAKGQGLGPPQPFTRGPPTQMDKGWGPPTPHDLGRQGPQPFST